MNKAELIDVLTEKLGTDRRQATAAVENVVDTIVRAVHKGDSVTITGFGVFEQRRRAARVARNPRTGETVKVKPTSVPAFRPGAQFKAVVSGAQKLPANGPAVKRGVTAGSTARKAVKKAVAKKAAAKKARRRQEGRGQEGCGQEGRRRKKAAVKKAAAKKAAPAVKKAAAKKARPRRRAGGQEGRRRRRLSAKKAAPAVKKAAAKKAVGQEGCPAAKKGSGQARSQVVTASNAPRVVWTRGVFVCRGIARAVGVVMIHLRRHLFGASGLPMWSAATSRPSASDSTHVLPLRLRDLSGRTPSRSHHHAMRSGITLP